MKKVLFFMTLVIILAACFMIIMSSVAFATDGEETPQVSDEFFTWGMLATYAGCLAATLLLTQLLKGIWIASWPTQVLSYIIALVILVGANWALGTLTLNSGLLCIFNAAVVSLAANGGFNNIKEFKTETSKKST